MTTKAKAAGTDIRPASNTTDLGNSTVSSSCHVGVVADWLQLVVQKTGARKDSRVLPARIMRRLLIGSIEAFLPEGALEIARVAGA